MAEENKSQPRGITKIGVDGFKSLRNAEIEIRPLTILAGANSSGKSAIMQPLLLMKQTLEKTQYGVPLWLGGENVIFSDVSEFFPSKSDQDADQILQITLVGNALSFIVRLRRADKALELIDNQYPHAFKTGLVITENMRSHQIRELIAQVDNSFAPDSDMEWQVSSRGPFLDFAHGENGFRGSFNLSSQFQRYVAAIIHVPGLRGTAERRSPATMINSHIFPGRFDSLTAGVLNYWQHGNIRHLEIVSSQLRELGLTHRIITKMYNATSIEIRVGRTLTSDESDLVSIADVGFGVSQVLPVLVALLVAEPGQLVYIEQPELHLHPRAQHKLAEFIAEAANRGVRVVMETHSDILLRGIQTLVVKHEMGQDGISKDDVILHWFSRGEDGLTQIKQGYLNEDGAYGNWPVDFAQTDFEADSEYLDAIEDRREMVKPTNGRS